MESSLIQLLPNEIISIIYSYLHLPTDIIKFMYASKFILYAAPRESLRILELLRLYRPINDEIRKTIYIVSPCGANKMVSIRRLYNVCTLYFYIRRQNQSIFLIADRCKAIHVFEDYILVASLHRYTLTNLFKKLEKHLPKEISYTYRLDPKYISGQYMVRCQFNRNLGRQKEILKLNYLLECT